MTDAIKQNEHIYDRLWAKLPIPTHTEWPIWSELQKEIHSGSRLLEMGAGVLPRIPVEGGYFVDLSQAALRKLDVFGGHGVRAAGPLPFCDGAFDVVCAFEVLEHIPDDETVLHELSRVLRPGGALPESWLTRLPGLADLAVATSAVELAVMAAAQPFDVYHGNDLNTLPAAAWAARLRNRPYVYDAHEFYVEESPTLRAFERRARQLCEQRHCQHAVARGRY